MVMKGWDKCEKPKKILTNNQSFLGLWKVDKNPKKI